MSNSGCAFAETGPKSHLALMGAGITRLLEGYHGNGCSAGRTSWSVRSCGGGSENTEGSADGLIRREIVSLTQA